MQITEEDRYREEEEINRMSDVVAQQFDEFAQEHPAEEQGESDGLVRAVPVARRLKKEIHESAIPEKRPL